MSLTDIEYRNALAGHGVSDYERGYIQACADFATWRNGEQLVGALERPLRTVVETFLAGEQGRARDDPGPDQATTRMRRMTARETAPWTILILGVAAIWVGYSAWDKHDQPHTRNTATMPPLHSSRTATPAILHGTIRKASDGDTIHLTTSSGDVTIRVLGVDTPETHDPRKPVQCYGPEAATFVRIFAEGRAATARTEAASGDTIDRYGRLLAYVGLRHRDLGATLLRLGYAKVYAYGDRHFKRRASYERLEAAARARHAGRWGACP